MKKQNQNSNQILGTQLPETKKWSFNTKYNFKLSPSHMEYNEGQSMTIPGQAYTISEILEKYTRGQAPRIAKDGYYEENPSLDSIDPMRSPDFDLADATILLDQYNETRAQNATKGTPDTTGPEIKEPGQKSGSEADAKNNLAQNLAGSVEGVPK